jgi:hypothetical protein
MAQFSRQFTTPNSQDANPDRWYYNALLSNPATGDTTAVPGRFSELRTVPLLNNCEGYFVALARLAVVGSTASLPVLIPPISTITSTSSATCVSDYTVALRWTFKDATTGYIYGYSSLIVEPVVYTSLYPDADRSNVRSQFYWMDSADQLTQAINAALERCAWQTGWSTTAVPGSTLSVSNTMPVCTQLPFNYGKSAAYLSFDKSSYRASLHMPAPGSGGTSPYYTYSGLNVSAIGATGPLVADCNVFFNDKLLEVLPMEVYPAVPTAGLEDVFYVTVPGNKDCRVSLGTTSFTVPPGTYAADQLAAAIQNALLVTNPTFAMQYVYDAGSSGWRFRMSFTVASGTATLMFTPDLRIIMGWDPVYIFSPTASVYISPRPAMGIYNNPSLFTTLPWVTSPQTYGSTNMYAIVTEPKTATSYDATQATPWNNHAGAPAAEYVYEQEYEVTGSWAPYTGMAITSNMMPAVEEAMGVNITPNASAVADASASTSNIIFDLDLGQDSLHQIQQGIAFIPASYRWVKLKAAPLPGIDLNFFLRRRDGGYEPWMVANGGTISVKLMFCRVPY